MTLKILIFICCAASIMCGNVFAVSPYANTISQNTSLKKSFLAPASFPTTIANASFIERIENMAAGYEPYFNRSAFSSLTIKEQDELETMFDRAEADRLTALRTWPREKYCLVYTDDFNNCPQNTTTITTTWGTPPKSIYDNLVRPGTPNQNTNSSDLYMNMAVTPTNIAMYNLKTYNGGCTPPESSNWWSNNIQTSGRYQNIDPSFEKFMITAFRKEGYCGLINGDKGGYTCYGCASAGLCAGIDMKTVTRAKVEDLAYQKIYKAYNVDKLPDAFRDYALWGMWGSGAVTGIKLFQSVLNVPKTGKIDDATIKAAERYHGDFADAYTYAQEQFYRNVVAKNAAYQRQGVLNGYLNALPLLRTSGCHIAPTNPIFR